MKTQQVNEINDDNFVYIETDNFNEQWKKASLELIENPDDLSKWEKLIEASEINNDKGLSKSTDKKEIELMKLTYKRFLKKYPLLFNYWIRFAEWCFKLGDTKKSIEIYEESLGFLSYSIEIWISYLKFKLKTLSNNIDEILVLFEKARKKIGNHFHAHEFYKLYLSFLENYDNEKNDFKKKFFFLLRYIVEIPLYNYEYFFKILFDNISKISNNHEGKVSILKMLVPEKDLHKLTKTKDYKSISNYIKKIFVDLYITTQYKVYEFFQYEKNLTKQYFDTSYISQEELDTWECYINFLELKNLPNNYIILTFERCMISTALYPRFWIKYSDRFISLKQNLKSTEILSRGIFFCSNYQLIIKLFDIYIYLNFIMKARDLLLLYFKYNSSVPIPIYEKLLVIERIMNPNEDDYILLLTKELILHTNNPIFLKFILNYSISSKKKKQLIMELEKNFGESETFKSVVSTFNTFLDFDNQTENEIDFASEYNTEIEKYR